MLNLNKVNIFIALLIQFSLYSSHDQKDIGKNNSQITENEKTQDEYENVLKLVTSIKDLQTIITDYSVGWQPAKTITDMESEIASFAISPVDGKYLAIVNNDGRIKIWSSETGALIKNFTGFGYGARKLSFSKSDDQCLTVSESEWLHIINCKSGKEIRKFRAPDHIYSKDGKYLAARISDKTIGIYETICYKRIKEFSNTNQDVDHILAFASNNEDLAYSSSVSSVITILNINTSKKKYISIGDNVRHPISSSFSTDNNFLALGYVGKVKVWEIETGKLIHTFLETGKLASTLVEFSQNGKFLAAASGPVLKIWDFNTRHLLKEIEEKEGIIRFMNFLPNNYLAYVLGSHKLIAQQIKVWQYEGI